MFLQNPHLPFSFCFGIHLFFIGEFNLVSQPQAAGLLLILLLQIRRGEQRGVNGVKGQIRQKGPVLVLLYE